MADKLNNGWPAFPNPGLADPTCSFQSDVSGMTLRDWFAGKVLGGMLANCDEAGLNGWGGLYADAAKQAYMFADAMLAAREAAQ